MTNNIGTYGEKALHRELKWRIEPTGEFHEIPVGKFIADVKTEEGIVEIQTRSFARLREKLTAFLPDYNVTLVYPLAHEKLIVSIAKNDGDSADSGAGSGADSGTGAGADSNADGGEVNRNKEAGDDSGTGGINWAVGDKEANEYNKMEQYGKNGRKILRTRRSPKKGSFYSALLELYWIKNLLTYPSLRLRLILLDVSELRCGTGKKYRYKKVDTIIRAVHSELTISCANDYLQLVPPSLKESFTSRDYAAATGMNLRNAGTALNVLHHVGAINRIGKSGRMYLYTRLESGIH